MQVNLHPDSCREYLYWSQYCKDNKPSAVFNTCVAPYDALNYTKRNSFNRSVKLGYTSREITWQERTFYLDDIHEINTSAPIRQGNPMKDSYLEYPKVITGHKKCEHHYGTFIGCFNSNGKLVAYITTNFCGELAAASQILGHDFYLEDGIMVNIWLVFAGICHFRRIKAIVYSRWDDGLKGLQDWKKAIGLKPEILEEKHIDNPKLL